MTTKYLVVVEHTDGRKEALKAATETDEALRGVIEQLFDLDFATALFEQTKGWTSLNGIKRVYLKEIEL